MAVFGLDALRRRMTGVQDPRSSVGEFSRGSNIYNGGSNAAQRGGPNIGRPRKANDPNQMQLGGPGGLNPGARSGSQIQFPEQTAPGWPQNRQNPFEIARGTGFQVRIPEWDAPEGNPFFGKGPGGSNAPAPSQPPPGSSFGFDPEYAQGLREIQEQLSGIQSQEELQRRRLGESYERQTGQVPELQEQELQRLRDQMASQGILHSGIFVGEQGDVRDQFKDYLEQLGTQKANALEDITRSATGAKQQLENQKSQLEIDRARREVESQRQQALEDAQRQAQEDYNRQLEDMNRQLNMVTTTPGGQYIPQIQQAFQQAGQEISGAGETPDQTLARIAGEMAGGRTLENLQQSLQWRAQQAQPKAKAVPIQKFNKSTLKRRTKR